MTKLLENTYTSAWMIDESNIPYLAELMDKIDPSSQTIKESKPEARVFFMNNENNPVDGYDVFTGKASDNSVVAMHYVSGLITMDWTWYSSSSISLMNDLKLADNNDAVVAHVISCNSGGGEATNIKTVFDFIQNEIKKPVLASIKGRGLSAMYFIAAAADEVSAEQETDLLGSVGVVTGWRDISEQLAKLGIKDVTVFATKSTKKGEMSDQVSKGNYTLLRSKILDPHQKVFESSIRAARQITDEEVFTGQIYTAIEAIENGLIDGIKTEKEVIARAFELGTQDSNTNNYQNNTNMKSYTAINTLMGREYAVDAEGGMHFDAEALTKLEEALANTNPEAVAAAEAKATAAADRTTEVEAKLASLETAMDAKITAMEHKFQEALKGDADNPAPAPNASEVKNSELADDFWKKQDAKYGLG